MTSAAPSNPSRAAKLTLRLPPFAETKLPELVISDELIGGTFVADRNKLEALRAQIFGSEGDETLVPNSRGKFEVLVDHGLVKIAAGKRNDPVLPCSFVSFRILVAPRDSVPDAPESPLSVPGLRAVVTHLFVDQPWAMIYGRDIFGFPAIHATIRVTDNELVVLVDGPERDTQSRVLELTWQPKDGQPEGDFWKMLKATKDAKVAKIPMLQQKQMRDPLDPARACYQTRVEGCMSINVDTIDLSGQAQMRTVENRIVTLTLAPGDGLALGELGLPNPAVSQVGYSTDTVTLGMSVESPPQDLVVRTASTGPALRQRRGDPQAAPAYTFDDVEIVGFRLPVKLERLQRVCDTWLNDPFPERRYKYVAANVGLVVECLDYPIMRAENPPPGVSNKDSTQQRELIFRMLVGRVDEDGRMLRAPAVFCPYLFVDNVASLISGREVVGYPKIHATFDSYGERGQFDACQVKTIPPVDGSPTSSSLLLTFDCRFERKPRDIQRVFAKAEADRPPLGPMPATFPIPLDFAWWTLPELRSGGHLDSFIEPWLEGHVSGYHGVQAKQFPDAANLKSPCYHEIVECEYALLRADVSLPTSDATLHFPEDDSYGIAEAFGFSRVVPVPPGSWYRTHADFAFRMIDPLA